MYQLFVQIKAKSQPTKTVGFSPQLTVVEYNSPYCDPLLMPTPDLWRQRNKKRCTKIKLNLIEEVLLKQIVFNLCILFFSLLLKHFIYILKYVLMLKSNQV